MRTKLFKLVMLSVLLCSLLLSYSPMEASALRLPGLSDVPKKYIPVYQKAAAKYGIHWTILAAIHGQETSYSSLSEKQMVSSAGAIGHMQFMRQTWVGWSSPSSTNDFIINPSNIKKYGGYGVDADNDGKAEPYNIADAMYAAGNLLVANLKTSKDGIDGALRLYNGSSRAYNNASVIQYSSDVRQRAKNIEEQYKGEVLDGADRTDGKIKDGMWYDGKGLDTGDTSGEDSKKEEGEATSGGNASGGGKVEPYVSPFKKYENEVANVGVKAKELHEQAYVSYQINKYVRIIGSFLLSVTQISMILIVGYMSILWLLFLLARNEIFYMDELVYKLSNGMFDTNDGLGKITKYTLAAYFFLIIASTGLIAKLLQFIYIIILGILNFLTYNL